MIWPVCSSHFTQFLWAKGISLCAFNFYIELGESIFMYFVKDCTSSTFFGAFSFFHLHTYTNTNECTDAGQKACYLNIDFECQQIVFFIGQQGNLFTKRYFLEFQNSRPALLRFLTAFDCEIKWLFPFPFSTLYSGPCLFDIKLTRDDQCLSLMMFIQKMALTFQQLLPRESYVV